MEANGCPLVLVEWVDSQESSGWTDWEKIREETKPLVVRSVGWVRHSNPENLTIVSHSVTEEGMEQATGIMTIPTTAINKITALQIKKPPRKSS